VQVSFVCLVLFVLVSFVCTGLFCLSRPLSLVKISLFVSLCMHRPLLTSTFSLPACCSALHCVSTARCSRYTGGSASLFCLYVSFCSGWRRRMGCLIFVRHFPQKNPVINGSVAERDLQLKACCVSSPPCRYMSLLTCTLLTCTLLTYTLLTCTLLTCALLTCTLLTCTLLTCTLLTCALLTCTLLTCTLLTCTFAYQRPARRTHSLKRPTKETYKRDLQKKPTKET